MKRTKEKVFVAALAVCILAIVSYGTLAWFTAQDKVTNTFHIASSDDTDPDDIFSIDVWETTPEGDHDTDGYSYDDVLPGDVLTKVVHVENTGYYDQYVRVTVTVSDAQAWMQVLGTTEVPLLSKIVEGYDSSLWTNRSGKLVDDTFVYTLYYKGILDGSDENNDTDLDTSVITVFTAVKIPSSMTVEQAALFRSEFNITVLAEAVQTENLGDNAFEAFAAIEN